MQLHMLLLKLTITTGLGLRPLICLGTKALTLRCILEGLGLLEGAFIVLQGHMFAERLGSDGKTESAVVGPGSLISCAAFLSGTRSRASLQAAEMCRIVVLGSEELDILLVSVDCHKDSRHQLSP